MGPAAVSDRCRIEKACAPIKGRGAGCWQQQHDTIAGLNRPDTALLVDYLGCWLHTEKSNQRIVDLLIWVWRDLVAPRLTIGVVVGVGVGVGVGVR